MCSQLSVECDEFDWKKTGNGARRLDGAAVDDSDGDESMSEAGSDTRPLLSSNGAVFVAESSQITRRNPHKVLTSSRKVDEYKPLVQGRDNGSDAGEQRAGAGRRRQGGVGRAWQILPAMS